MKLVKSVVTMVLSVAAVCGAQQAPAGPAPQAAAQAAAAKAATPFPAPNPRNFTAASPSKDEVNSFLKELWGYDPNRIWSVSGIQATAAPGVSKVSVLVGETTQPGKEASSVFYVTPDGKHAVAGDVIDFGPKPFAEKRAALMTQATGAARGAKGKELLLVEFADLQCPRCKDAQESMDQLLTDFPQARIVFENFPLHEVHPYADLAAAMGVCVRKEKGDEAFFTYASAVYEVQAALTESNHTGALNTAIARAGADPKTVTACAATPAATEAVAADRRMGEALGVAGTPTLFVNGWSLPLSSLPYETLKRMVAYRAGLDGVPVTLQPSLKSLK